MQILLRGYSTSDIRKSKEDNSKMSEGGYLLPEGTSEALEWMKREGIVKIVREVKFDAKTWKKLEDTFHYFRADGTEYEI